jgi:hypothetical protein
MHGNSARLLDEFNARTDQRDIVPKDDLKPPTFGAAQRQAIDSVVDSMSNDICQRIEGLRKQLDEIQQMTLAGADDAKAGLHSQILLSVRLSDEINHTSEVIAELRDLVERRQ